MSKNKAELKLKRLYSKIKKGGFRSKEDTQTAIARTWFKAERKLAVKHLLNTLPRLVIRNFPEDKPYCPTSPHDKVYQAIELVDACKVDDYAVYLTVSIPTKGKGSTYALGNTVLLSLRLETEDEVLAERDVLLKRKVDPNPRALFVSMVEQVFPHQFGRLTMMEATAEVIERYLKCFSFLGDSHE